MMSTKRKFTKIARLFTRVPLISSPVAYWVARERARAHFHGRQKASWFYRTVAYGHVWGHTCRPHTFHFQTRDNMTDWPHRQAVDKGRVVVYDADYKSRDPIKINAAAKPACLALTKEGQVSYKHRTIVIVRNLQHVQSYSLWGPIMPTISI